MQPSSAKKRRLAALNQHRGGSAASAALQLSQLLPQHPAVALAAAVATAPSNVAVQPAALPSAQQQPGAFPYTPLNGLAANTSSVAAKLLLPTASNCTGNVEDLLEQLMRPNMPPSTARSMIATRTTDKSVVLDNPTAKLNITRPNTASKGKRHLLAGKLLPRAKRRELSELPGTVLDYPALLQLHELWLKYVCGVLANKPEPERLWQHLDLHGALLRVTSCKNPLHDGCAGIVAKAQANSLLVVGPDGRGATVPIKGTTFECLLPPDSTPVALTGPFLGKLQCSSTGGQAGGPAG